MRAKLGLKPLDTAPKQADEQKESLKDDIHKPAVNISDVKRSEAMREKMAAAKERRKLNQKLGSVIILLPFTVLQLTPLAYCDNTTITVLQWTPLAYSDNITAIYYDTVDSFSIL